jgi:hypothetical protein
VSSKEGTFSKEGGHKSQEKFSMSFGPKYFYTVGGCTVRIRTFRTILYNSYNCMDLAQKTRHIWARFRGVFQIFVRCFWAVRNIPYS